MKNKNYNDIVKTAGNTIDCDDLATVNFQLKNSNCSFKILENDTIGYNQKWINTLNLPWIVRRRS